MVTLCKPHFPLSDIVMVIDNRSLQTLVLFDNPDLKWYEIWSLLDDYYLREFIPWLPVAIKFIFWELPTLEKIMGK